MEHEGMIAGCPKCGARYRIAASRLRAEGVRLRCSRCEAVFRVTPPAGAALVRAAAPAEPPEAVQPRPEAQRQRLVLVAAPDVEAGKAIAAALADWGLEPILVHDGVEAVLTIQRSLPRAVVLDAALPKMFGFQICELLKRNDSLRSIRVVLVGAIHDEARYRRPPSDLYGADAYAERPQLPHALRPILASFGFEVTKAPARERREPVRASEPAPIPHPEPVRRPEPARAPPPPTAAPAGVAAAERLARIIVSDVVLYNAEKFEAGVRNGNVVQALQAELDEGRALFHQRVDARLRASRDFLADELIRVARARGMK
jgi:predicted Zn finger-like uncharacterized protein